MLQPNEIYLNGNNSTVQIASAHETSKTFSYNGNEVLFDIKDDVMVNATQLAKIYGKRPNDYLSLPATNQLINAITRKYGISENQLVISKAGSSHNGGGTWMHEDVVLEFLSTLSAVRIIPLTGLVVWKVCVTLYRSQMTIAFVTLSKRLSCSYHTWFFLCPYWILAVAFT